MKARGAVVVLAAILLSGCANVQYYAQAVGGHLELVRRAVPIEERLREPEISATLRDKLTRVLEIRAFASGELKLPNNGTFRTYADIGRPFVVWNVFSAPEFSVKPVESCFPFSGCVTYRGYYSEEAAQRFAASMKAQGNDVFVGGVPAYSTLGWFDDPVLSTFIQYPDAELARLIFHELAHQVLYVKNDTMFNESFAVAVEEEGVRRWLETHGTPVQKESYARFRQRRQDFVALVLKYRKRLGAFYAEPGSAETHRAGKQRLFEEMREEYAQLKKAWGGVAAYDRFFAQPPNNALLASVATYTELVPALRALLQDSGSLEQFYKAAIALAALPKAARYAKLGAEPPDEGAH
jgi:predicted aminopeptidase